MGARCSQTRNIIPLLLPCRTWLLSCSRFSRSRPPLFPSCNTYSWTSVLSAFIFSWHARHYSQERASVSLCSLFSEGPFSSFLKCGMSFITFICGRLHQICAITSMKSWKCTSYGFLPAFIKLCLYFIFAGSSSTETNLIIFIVSFILELQY